MVWGARLSQPPRLLRYMNLTIPVVTAQKMSGSALYELVHVFTLPCQEIHPFPGLTHSPSLHTAHSKNIHFS